MDMKLYLWMLKFRNLRFEKYYFRMIKHLNQIYAEQKDLFDKEVPVRSKTEQYNSDIIFNFLNFYYHQMLTLKLPEEKQATFRQIKVVKSRESLLQDISLYFRKVDSALGLTLQNLRIRQYLEFAAGVCNVLVKAKAYRQ